jgi:DNA-binding MarR family transcriptional regulator
VSSSDQVRPPSLLEQPSYLVASVARALHAEWLDELAQHDLRPWHFATLSALADFGPLVQHELADRLNIKRSNLVGYVDELARRDLVRRERDASDRRRQRVVLTAAGSSFLHHLRLRAQRTQPDLLRVLSEPERDTLLALLGRILLAYDDARLSTSAAHRMEPG